MREELLASALAYHEAGITVAPLPQGSKIPKKGERFSQFRERPQREEELPALFGDGRHNIAALAGSVSGCLFVLDHDSRTKVQELTRYPAYSHALAVSPSVKTYRGLHLWLRAPYPVSSSVCPSFKTDLMGELKYVVAPPSEVRREHGTLQLYLFGDGSGTITGRPIYSPSAEEWTELAELFGIRPYAERSKPGDIEPSSGFFYGLGEKTWAILRGEAEALSGYPSRSEAEAAVIYRCAAIGWSLGDIAELFRRNAWPGSKYREKLAGGHAEDYLALSFTTAETTLLATMGDRDREINTALLALAERNPFTGRAAGTDRAVLVALLQIMRETGRSSVAPGLRRIAERAGMDYRTAYNSVGRLEAAGLLHSEEGNGSRVFNFVKHHLSTFLSLRLGSSGTNGERDRPSQLDTSPSETIAGRPELASDAYRSKALGKRGPSLLASLSAQAGRPFVLADLPLPVLYVRRALALLERASLVERLPSDKGKRGRPALLYRLPRKILPSDLERIAEAAGTLGMGARQKRIHEEESRQWLATRRKAAD
jgi:DNA-binding MarR family transcriptional regulator